MDPYFTDMLLCVKIAAFKMLQKFKDQAFANSKTIKHHIKQAIEMKMVFLYTKEKLKRCMLWIKQCQILKERKVGVNFIGLS